jgi:hypothetical protein
MDTKLFKPTTPQMDIYEKDPFDEPPEEKPKMSGLKILWFTLLGLVVILIILTQVMRPQDQPLDNLVGKAWCKVNLFCSADDVGTLCDCPPLIAFADEE